MYQLFTTNAIANWKLSVLHFYVDALYSWNVYHMYLDGSVLKINAATTPVDNLITIWQLLDFYFYNEPQAQ